VTGQTARYISPEGESNKPTNTNELEPDKQA